MGKWSKIGSQKKAKARLKLTLACILFSIGHVLIWFQFNARYVWEWWAEKPLHAILLFGMPATVTFYYAWDYAVQALNAVWGARLLTFGVSFLTFPLMTYIMLKESMFTPKTLSCIALAICIVCIQAFWK